MLATAAADRSWDRSPTRRSFLKATGAIAAGVGVLGGASRSTAAREPSSTPPSSLRRYAGEVTGTLHYAGGGAAADRDQKDTSFAHPILLTVVDQRRATGPSQMNPIDVVLGTTPAVTEPLEGDINILTGAADTWGDEIIDYTPFWTVRHDPDTGETRGSKLPTGASVNSIWVWWFGIYGVVVPQPIVPPSSFSGTITERAADLRLTLGDPGPSHHLRADLSAVRIDGDGVGSGNPSDEGLDG